MSICLLAYGQNELAKVRFFCVKRKKTSETQTASGRLSG